MFTCEINLLKYLFAMGKKDKKKGKGIEKTVQKTEKKMTAKQKKMVAKMGEEDIESIVAQIEEEERKRLQVKEISIEKPTRRANFAFVAHPLKDELVLFGGEYYNGQKTLVYNDLIFFNIIKRTWSILQAPGAPPPRCGHQMVAVPSNKGQLWTFGGEFTSTTESQFHHYRDLWVFHLGDRVWEKVQATGGPSARSGHRMVALKKQLFIFGGYHDNLGDYKYFNDLHIFDMDTYKWIKIEPNGTPPSPRSGCQMVPTKDGKIVIYGGYSKEKVKKDVDKGIVHSDMFLLSPEKNDTTGLKWKWMPVKQGGAKLSPRTGCSITLATADKAFTFGGVYDVVEEEEDLSGNFYNDLTILDLERRVWRTAFLTGKKDTQQVKKRRRKEGEEEEETDDVTDGDEVEMEGEPEPEEPVVTTVTDGVFTMTVGPAPAKVAEGEGSATEYGSASALFAPSPRMSCGLAVKHGFLYLYGGTYEDGDKEITFADLYRLDTHKLDEWQTLLEDLEAAKEWITEESDDDEDDDDDESDEDSDEDDDAMDTD